MIGLLKRVFLSTKQWLVMVLVPKVITPCGLTIIYFFVIGPIWAIRRLGRVTRIFKTEPALTSNWKLATDYELSLQSESSQS